MDLQMKQANFDVTHELDEFLMVERPLQHTKRKVNPDLDKMKPELRQLQEECVHLLSFCGYHYLTSAYLDSLYMISARQSECLITHIINPSSQSAGIPTTIQQQ
jgi:hypothetical protein